MIRALDDTSPKEVDALIITHRYDTSSLYITLPELYEVKHPVPELQALLNEVAN